MVGAPLTRPKYIAPRGFFVYTDDIFDETKWSEPIHFDNLGIDQDVRGRGHKRLVGAG